ncbi:MAG: UPF0147 family protein [Candidatus Woesearchaeota archaeon]
MNPQIEEVIDFMSELESDSNVPKNIKNKFSEIISELKKADESNLSLTINKLLSDLDDISGDANLDQFTRQQIWSISSMLEGIDA